MRESMPSRWPMRVASRAFVGMNAQSHCHRGCYKATPLPVTPSDEHGTSVLLAETNSTKSGTVQRLRKTRSNAPLQQSMAWICKAARVAIFREPRRLEGRARRGSPRALVPEIMAFVPGGRRIAVASAAAAGPPRNLARTLRWQGRRTEREARRKRRDQA